jgi:hypothetical protein
VSLLAVALLLTANVVVPLVGGDIYPFTSAPMFRDRPAGCCNYRVILEGGSEAPAAEWLVQRIYDGNPVGYGVGVRPPAVLEKKFGIAHERADVQQHFERLLSRAECKHATVEVVQEVIGPLPAGTVGVVSTHRWRFSRPQASAVQPGP